MKPWLRVSTLAGVGLAVAIAVPSVTRGGDDWKKSFNEKFSSQNSWEKANALKALDPEQSDQLKMLMKVAKEGDWFLRNAVADVLAKGVGKNADDLKKELKSGKGLGAEVVATGYGRSKDVKFVEELCEQLKKSSDNRVKRACAIALGNLPDKKGVTSLIEALDKEAKNFVVFVHVLEALERATGEKDKKTAADWKGWWTGAEPNWVPPGERKDVDDEDKKSGERIRTTVKGTDLDFRSRGKGRPLLVLPEYGYEKDYFETYLRNLEDTNQILYMKLPGTADFKPALPNRQGTDQPDYPIDRLVESLEELRSQLIKDKKLEDKPYAILGHGITAWVAIRYASKAPKGVSRLILCSTYASGRAFSRNLTQMEQEGKKTNDLELEHYAQILQYVNNVAKYTPKSEEEQEALSRKAFTTMFGDWQDLEIGRIYGPKVNKPGFAGQIPQVIRPMGGCWVPDFDLAKEPEIVQPTLVVGGQNAFFGTPADVDELLKHCQKGKAFVSAKGARMPFIEDNKKFVEALEKFLH